MPLITNQKKTISVTKVLMLKQVQKVHRVHRVIIAVIILFEQANWFITYAHSILPSFHAIIEKLLISVILRVEYMVPWELLLVQIITGQSNTFYRHSRFAKIRHVGCSFLRRGGSQKPFRNSYREECPLCPMGNNCRVDLRQSSQMLTT